MTQWTLVHLAKARASRARASTEKAKAKESKDSKDNTDTTGTRARTTTRTRLNVGIVEDVDTARKIVSSRSTKGGSKGKHRPRSAAAHNLDSKPSIVEPEVEIDEFNMTYLNVDALQEGARIRMDQDWS